MINILLFAKYRELLDTEKLELDADNIDSINDIKNHLSQLGAAWQQVFEQSNLLVAINQQMARLDSPVKDGDEVAFFPPVTGG